MKLKNVPEELHRYFGYNRGLQLLKSGKLYFSDPFSYNDIFECSPSSSFLDSSFNVAHELKEMKETEEGRKILGYVDESLSTTDILTASAVAGSATIISAPVITLVGVALAGIYAMYKKSKPKERDKYEYFIKHFLPVMGTAKACCFTEEYDNILMWSHYAGWNAGITISFKTDLKYWVGEQFLPVQYSYNRVPLPELDENNYAYLQKLLTTKAECWEYEKEWRIVKFDKLKKTFIRVNPSSISAIRLGLRIGEDERNVILELRNRLYPNAVVYVERLSKEGFTLEFEKL